MTGTATAQAYEPRYIRLDPRDNVAIVVNDLGLPARSRFACGLELRSLRAAGPQGGAVGHCRGRADPPLQRGDRHRRAADPGRRMGGRGAHSTCRRRPNSTSSNSPPRVPAPQAPLEGYTFEGFRNPDGSVGTKNVLAISTSVQCVAGTLQFAIKRIKAELLPKYPNVDDVVGLTHNYGCGVAINAPLAIVPIRTLQNLALNPNFGGEVMVVGLGCEKLVARAAAARGGRWQRRADAGRGVRRFRRHRRRHHGDGGRAPCRAQRAPPRNLPRLRPRDRPAMRRHATRFPA